MPNDKQLRENQRACLIACMDKAQEQLAHARAVAYELGVRDGMLRKDYRLIKLAYEACKIARDHLGTDQDEEEWHEARNLSRHLD